MNYQSTQLYGFIIALLCSLSTPTHALEQVKQPIQTKANRFHWSGPYLGGFVGGAFGSSLVKTHTGTVSSNSYFPSHAIIHDVNLHGTGSPQLHSLIGGIQLTGNWVNEQFVYGFLFNYESFNQSRLFRVTSIPYPDNSGNYSLETSISTNWLYTLRGRIGFISNTLQSGIIYASGGLASTRMHLINNFHDNSPLAGFGVGENQSSETGWTLGGGIEFPLTSNLTLNSEYLYVQFNPVSVVRSISNTVGGPGVPPGALTSPFKTTAKLHSSLLTIGLNYKFSENVAD